MPRPKRPDFTPRLAEYRRRRGLTQEDVAARLELSVEMIRRHERGAAFPKEATRRRYVRLYGASQAELGLALTPAAEMPLASPPSPAPMMTSGASGEGTDSDVMDRRTVLRTAASATGVIVTGGALFRLSEAISAGTLNGGGLLQLERVRAGGLDRIQRRLESHWKRYQAGVYRPILAELPDILSDLDASASHSSGTPGELHGLRSRAYQLAASLSYKFGDPAIGLIAAERGLSAAGQAGDSLLGAVALTRVAHGLRESGHADSAIDLNLRGAGAVESDGNLDDAASASVYGALLLHGALATAKKGDGGTARILLQEARSAARYSGESNFYYTAFGPTNVAAWGVAALILLQDYSGALSTAERIDLSALPVAERKGSLLLDRASAHVAHGKRDADVVGLLLSAERLAPGEVYARPASRTIAAELLRQPGTTRREPLRELIRRIDRAS